MLRFRATCTHAACVTTGRATKIRSNVYYKTRRERTSPRYPCSPGLGSSPCSSHLLGHRPWPAAAPRSRRSLDAAQVVSRGMSHAGALPIA